MIRAARDERGLTQEELAEAVGRSQEWVGKVESGEILAPRSDVLHRLASTLDLSVADLYIAAEWARTRAEALKIAESVPAYDEPFDPTFWRFVEAAGRLSDEDRELLYRFADRLFATQLREASPGQPRNDDEEPPIANS